jgi:hypothetical protein
MAESAIEKIQKGVFELRFRAVWHLRWNELARKRQAFTKSQEGE